MKKLLVRLGNKKVLLSVISGILLILVQLNVIDVEMSHNVDVVVNTVLGLLVAVGVVSDPESHLKK
ncbi:phage holin [Priestia aryabhattai]|uniref:phage holin n=1 Tax=Priestia aryabhattai TaxID=412384 RepID=UPI003D28CB75